MKTMMRCLVVVLYLITVSHAQWVKTSLDSIQVTALAVSEKTLFAGTDKGVFRSTNNGTSWDSVNTDLTNKDIYCLAVSGTNLFAGTSGGVFLSTNNGTNWTAVNTGLKTTKINCFAVSGSKIFAGTQDAGIFLTTNNGTKWDSVNTGLTQNYFSALTYSGVNLFAGSYGGKVFLSTNNGANWSSVNYFTTWYDTTVSNWSDAFMYDLSVSALTAFETNIFVGMGGWFGWVKYGDYSGYAHVSVNSGVNWMSAPIGHIRAFVASGLNIFTGISGKGVFITTDAGNTWVSVNDSLPIVDWIAYSTQFPSLAISDNYLFISLTSEIGLLKNHGIWRRPLSEMIPTTDSLLIPVAGGTFTAGTTPVTISSFKMDKYEVTYEKWTEVRNWALTHGYTDLAAGKNGYNPVGANNPVDSVNWYDIVKWCNARSEKDGLSPVYYTRSAQDTVYRTGEFDINVDAVKWTANGYRLPTEAEWEFAARGGNFTNGYTYSGSNTLDSVAWYAPNSSNTTHTVGTKAANELGIYDMSGNVWEWCWDWFDDVSGVYPSSGTADPKGPSTTQRIRLVRGGSFPDEPFSHLACRVDRRWAVDPSYRGVDFGFRYVQGSQVGTAVKVESRMPQTFVLAQNYPNPFNPSTTIRYSLPSTANIKLAVYDLLGREIATLVNEEQSAGWKEVVWNATGFSSGIYFYKLQAGSYADVKKMLVVK